MVEMMVDSVRISMGNQQRVVILKDSREERYLFIWIAQDMAMAIAQELQGARLQRPLTHDLLKSVISAMGGRVVEVAITELRDAIYHARITIEVDGRRIDVDSRTSDAIALAVRVKCPIYADESVLAEAAVVPDEAEPSVSQPGKRQSATSADDLSVYRDFINSLDILDEFDKSD
jgi:uncharacterized protein